MSVHYRLIIVTQTQDVLTLMDRSCAAVTPGLLPTPVRVRRKHRQ